jgi:molecular chaperone DnaJ
MAKDFYKTLDVEKGASQADIKKAFRKAAHEHHPDKGGDEAKFKEVNEAYQVLGDETKRQQYDQYGQTCDGAGGPGAGGFGGFGGQGVNFEDLGDLFGDMFGGGGRRGRRARGQDIQVDVYLSFKESVFGVEKEISVSKNNTCERCAGTGGEPATKMNTCDDCNGAGTKTVVQRTILGNVQAKVSCPICHGTGETPEEKCSTCDGIGLDYGRRTLRINIPAGVEDGMRIRVRGEGESIGASGETGDLYLNVHVKRDPRFHREGTTIYLEKEIGFTQAALGDEVQTDTVDGKVKLKIPAGTQHGDKLRMKGKGVQSGRGRGDQIVIVKVVTPKKLNRKQKKLMEELDLKI